MSSSNKKPYSLIQIPLVTKKKLQLSVSSSFKKPQITQKLKDESSLHHGSALQQKRIPHSADASDRPANCSEWNRGPKIPKPFRSRPASAGRRNGQIPGASKSIVDKAIVSSLTKLLFLGSKVVFEFHDVSWSLVQLDVCWFVWWLLCGFLDRQLDCSCAFCSI